MKELLGIPTTALAIALVGVMAAALGVVVALGIRNRVFVRLGVRNVGRRRARTALIVVGLMLGTTIIAAALATGDTMSTTIRGVAVESLGETDELISVAGSDVDAALANAAGDLRSGRFPESYFEQVRAAAGDSSLIDGLAPAITEPIAAQAPRTRQSEPRIGLFAIDPAHEQGIADIRTTDGETVSLADLRRGEVYLDSDAADELAARAGDPLQLLAGGAPSPARVRAVVDFDGAGTDGPAVLMPLAAAQMLLGDPGRINHILVSNRGDAMSGAELSDQVATLLKPALEPLGLAAETTKQDAIEVADEAGSAFMSFFTTFGAFSIAAGILLIFLIFVMLAAERRGELGIARAVGTRRSHLVQMFLFEGVAYDLAAAAVGALAGIGVAYGMVLLIAKAFAGWSDLEIVFSVTPQSIAIAYAVGVLLTLGIVTFSARRISRMNIVTAIRDLPDPPAERRRRRLVLPVAGVLFGAYMIVAGADARDGMSFDVGAAVVMLSLVSLARTVGVSDRVARSIGGLALLTWFMLPMGDWLVGEMSYDMSVFIVYGLMIVVATTWLIMYNAESLMRLPARLLGRWRGLAPVIRMAMAYPLRGLFRTGVTMGMFTLVVFTLVVGGTTSGAFTNAFNDLGTFAGGYDVRATTSPATPIGDMSVALRQADGVRSEDVSSVSSHSVLPVDARQGGDPSYTGYVARGFDAEFFDHTTYGFSALADGYKTAQDVWRAMRADPGLAVVDALAAPRRGAFGVGMAGDFQLHGFYVEDGSFAPVPVELRDPSTDSPVRLKVIGVLADTTPEGLQGIWTSQSTLEPVFGERAAPTVHFFDLRPGADATAFAQRLEATFLTAGMEADGLQDLLDEAVGANRTFNQLVQGFMGLGLVVGVVALGVISARSVVERRQQIGVLRAIGFRREMVQLCFVLESSFIALTSIVVGTAAGLGLAYNLISDAQSQPSWSGLTFDVPWLNLGLIFLAVYVVTVLTTLAPSLRASRVRPAEALRYQ